MQSNSLSVILTFAAQVQPMRTAALLPNVQLVQIETHSHFQMPAMASNLRI